MLIDALERRIHELESEVKKDASDIKAEIAIAIKREIAKAIADSADADEVRLKMKIVPPPVGDPPHGPR